MPWIRDTFGDPVFRAQPEPPVDDRWAYRDYTFAHDPTPLFYCDDCGAEIRRGEEYYDINGTCYCTDCMESKYLRIAEDD